MNLAVDIGNTCTKVTAFAAAEPRFTERCEGQVAERLRNLLSTLEVEAIACSCVGETDDEVLSVLRQHPAPLLLVTGETPAPVRIGYETPASLGADRLAAVVGAVTLYPETDLLVIDAGTCITYDLVTAAGEYLGGNISPGAQMRLEALHTRTARLPLVAAEGEVTDLGHNTEQAIRTGVVRGIGYELQGCIRHWQKRYPALRVLLTGGDGYIFSEAIRRDLLTDPHLVARGLNRLLAYNATTLGLPKALGTDR